MLTWIEYSPALDKAFCFPCRAFPGKGCMEDAFRKHGFNNLKKSTNKFSDHQNSISHLATMEQLIALRSSQQMGSVASQLNSAHEREVMGNREYLWSRHCFFVPGQVYHFGVIINLKIHPTRVTNSVSWNWELMIILSSTNITKKKGKIFQLRPRKTPK